MHNVTDGRTDRWQYYANSIWRAVQAAKTDEYSIAHVAKTGNNKETENNNWLL